MSSSGGSEDRARVDAWLRALGAKIGLQLQLDADGLCTVGHANGLDCAIEVPDGQGVVYLRIPLLPWPFGSPLALAERCLAENFLGMNTGGASFAIDGDERQLVMWLARPITTLDEAGLGGLIIDFFETAGGWKSELDEFCRREPTEQNPRLEREPGFVGMA